MVSQSPHVASVSVHVSVLRQPSGQSSTGKGGVSSIANHRSCSIVGSVGPSGKSSSPKARVISPSCVRSKRHASGIGYSVSALRHGGGGSPLHIGGYWPSSAGSSAGRYWPF